MASNGVADLPWTTIPTSSVDSLKQENIELKKMIQRPGNLLKRAGFVSVNTPLSEDVETDNFRADLDMGEATLLKGKNVIYDFVGETKLINIDSETSQSAWPKKLTIRLEGMELSEQTSKLDIYKQVRFEPFFED